MDRSPLQQPGEGLRITSRHQTAMRERNRGGGFSRSKFSDDGSEAVAGNSIETPREFISSLSAGESERGSRGSTRIALNAQLVQLARNTAVVATLRGRSASLTARDHMATTLA
jgi:hypothetical protein